MRWTVGAALLGSVPGLLLGPLAPRISGTEPVVAEETLERLQISPEQRRRMLRGETISYPVAESGERELAVGLAVFVSAPLARLGDYLVGGELIARDATILAHGLLDPAQREALPGPRFTSGEREEIDGLLDASPGTRFNLSAAEIDGLRAIRLATGTPASLTPDQVSDAYRGILRARWHAYQHGGLGAISPYVRGSGAVTDPAAELRLALPDAERVAGVGPRLRDALARYPASQPPEAASRFQWVKRRVQRRPDLSLLHQLVVAGSEVVVHVERYFYVGHSYNAAQIVTGAVAYQDGAVLFATSRFSTDEVVGLGNQLKRAVGRGQLRDEMRKRLEAVRNALARPAAPLQSP